MAKLKNQLQVSVSNDAFQDDGEGTITFTNGLTITDDSVMRSGTRYDINSLDIVGYAGQLTGDHEDSLGKLIGKVIGVQKTGNRVTVQGIKYAVKENPYARLAYDLLKGGFSNSFSIETIGPYPEDDRTYRNHELVGLSQVVVPNNYNARINQFNEMVHNSLERAQQDGLDITGVEEKIFSSVELKSSDPVEGDKMSKTDEKDTSQVENTDVKETEVKETEVVETNEETQVNSEVKDETEVKEEAEAPAEGETETKVENEGNVHDLSGTVPSDPNQPAEEVVESTEAPQKVEEVKEELKEVVDDKPTETQAENNSNTNKENIEMTKEEIAEIVAQSVAAALKPVQDELKEAKETAQNALDAQAKAPEFHEVEETQNSYDDMDTNELFGKQLNAAVLAVRMNSVEGQKVLNEINARNLEALKAEKIVNRALTVEDLGNFVVAPDLYRDIINARTDYTAILNATEWRDAGNVLEFGWLTRTADIDMQNVAIGALGDVDSPDVTGGTGAGAGIPTNERLKPVTVPGYGAHFDRMEEMAAVTPISINVIKYAAADILADVAAGYRNDYDRKRAQLVIARLQQAVVSTPRSKTYDPADGLVGWTLAVSAVSDVSTIGTLVFNNKTLSLLKSMAIESQNAAVLQEMNNNTLMGTPFIVVPNDLMPTLGSTGADATRTFQVAGVNVVVNHAVFYGDLQAFTGRTSGGLQYDVAAEASYEVFDSAGGRHVFSAYQRNEIVLRGAFFRGGVVRDPSVIAGLLAVTPA